MTIWAVVPVKPLMHGKSRLGGTLDDESRAKLNRELLIHTINVLAKAEAVEQTLVVSRDSGALALARELGARTVQEEGAPSLNLALRQASIVARGHSTLGVLVIPADLPLLKIADISALFGRATNPPVVVVAPDRHHRGTNALLLCPGDLFEYGFGERSFTRHCERARLAGARVEIVERPGLGLDLDLPEDLVLAKNAAPVRAICMNKALMTSTKASHPTTR